MKTADNMKNIYENCILKRTEMAEHPWNEQKYSISLLNDSLSLFRLMFIETEHSCRTICETDLLNSRKKRCPEMKATATKKHTA